MRDKVNKHTTDLQRMFMMEMTKGQFFHKQRALRSKR